MPVPAQKDRAELGAQPVPIAEIIGRARFAPAAGNGMRPIAAALDEKHGRLFVLNDLTRSVNVVDLRRRRTSAVVPLTFHWDHLNHYVWIGYDPVADRAIVLGNDMTQRYAAHVLVLSGSPLKVVEDRVIAGLRWLGRAVAIDPSRGEFYFAAWRYPKDRGWSVEALETRSLKTRRSLRTPSEVTALAVAPRAGLLVTAELYRGEPPGLGPIGAWSDRGQLIHARRLDTGQEVAGSPHQRRMAALLFVDESRNRVIVSHGGNLSGYMSTVSQLSLPGLDAVSEGKLPQRARNTPVPTAFDDALLDSSKGRLYALTPDGGKVQIAVLDLPTGAGRLVSVPGLSEGELSRLAGIGAAGRYLYVIAGNALWAIDLRTFRESWRLPLGASIRQIYLDRDSGRLLAEVETDRMHLVLAGRFGTRRLVDSQHKDIFHGDLATVDFRNRWIYYTLGTISGSGGYLARTSFEGKEDRAYFQSAPGHLGAVALGFAPGRTYRAIFPFNTDTTELKGWIGVYDAKQELRRVEFGRLPVALTPARGPDELYMVYSTALRTLGGRSIPIPRGNPPPKPDQAVPVPPDSAVPLDVVESADVFYYADPFDRILYKLRLKDGCVVSRRGVPFAASALAVDPARNIIYLVDWYAGEIVLVRMP